MFFIDLFSTLKKPLLIPHCTPLVCRLALGLGSLWPNASHSTGSRNIAK